MTRVVVVGAGIIGLALAARLSARGDDVLVVEKESAPALHQTGRNSGVIHSGLYYPPGTLKARFATAGQRSMIGYARERGIAVGTPGKLVVATDAAQVPRLRALAVRGRVNGVPLQEIGPEEAREFEPAVACVAALRVESTGVVDYSEVCASLVQDVTRAGGRIRLGETVRGARADGRGLRVSLSGPGGPEEIEVDVLVACAGLHADRVARACGLVPSARIVPFRGEYFELRASAAARVRGLVYPVPDPRFPFLGVHLTTSVHGSVHVGPNAVLALSREGYRWRDVSPTDVADALTWPGLWRLAGRAWRPGAHEVARSLSRSLFARSLAQYVPGITGADLVRAPAGVRAQALGRDGAMVDDFLVQTAPHQVHVLNAPSPAATAAFEIAQHLEHAVDRADARGGAT